MAEREAGSAPDPLPRPTPRQLVIRSIGTALVLGGLVAALLVVLDASDSPTDVTDLAEEPRTVAYGQLALQIPADWTNLADVDECGHVQGDTLVLGLAGVVACDEGERDPEATDVVMSSLTGNMVAPAPDVGCARSRFPAGCEACAGRRWCLTRRRRPTPDSPAESPAERPRGASGAESDEESDEDTDEESDQPPLRTTVLQLPSLDAQVVATSPDRRLVKGILNSAKPIPSGSPATLTAAYLFARPRPAADLAGQRGRLWAADVRHPGAGPPPAAAPDPAAGREPARPAAGRCHRHHPGGAGQRVRAPLGRAGDRPRDVAGRRQGPARHQGPADGRTLTVVLVPDLRVLAVARSAGPARWWTWS